MTINFVHIDIQGINQGINQVITRVLIQGMIRVILSLFQMVESLDTAISFASIVE